MGYFSNGTEGMGYEEIYCSRCVHQNGPDGKSGCAVWLAHLLFNYKLCNSKDEGAQILGLLIPRDEHAQNKQCTMFHEGKAVTAPEAVTVMPAMRDWAKRKGLVVK